MDIKKSRSQVTLWGANTGMLLLLVAGALPLLRVGVPALWKWLYVAGAAITLVCRLFQPMDAPTLRARRLKKMELWSAIVWAVGVFFIFYPKAGPTDWLAFFLAGGVLEAYASLAMPAALRSKEKR
ncbi:MAG: hypothetical protein NC342_05645 [Pseudoflavonifractor sp.]|nr:hypothetical protein [Alloprevotella sp.]MCM1117000.1 hypothetical protein [Pseudoflavonifractor sp.]